MYQQCNWYVQVISEDFVTSIFIFADSVQSLYPLLWRFLPVLDANVDVLLSRDLDSIITHREVAAVQEFLNSTYVIVNHTYVFNLQSLLSKYF